MNSKAMAGVASQSRPGYALQNRTQKVGKATESKTARYSPPARKYTTSYIENFCTWQIPKQASLKPADNLTRSDTEFQGLTTYQAEFGGKPSTGAQAPARQSFQSAVPFALQNALKPTRLSKLQGTIYAPNAVAGLDGDVGLAPRGKPKREKPGLAAPTKAAGEVGADRARRPFTYSTEYQDNFKGWPTPPIYKHVYPLYDPPKGTMQFVTSYGSEYRPWGNQTRPPIIQRQQSVWPKGSFQHATTYMVEYTPKMATPACTRPPLRR